MDKLYKIIKEREIKIKKYYLHYNEKDGKYYINHSYPQRENETDKNVSSLSFRGINTSFAPQVADELISPSAFRATNSFNIIPISQANIPVKVLFPNEQFDLGNNEYNTATSTFIPQTKGVYSFNASIFFQADNADIDYELVLFFTVNGLGPEADVDYIGFNAAFNGAIEVNDILQLNAGDNVEVFAISTTPGRIIADNRVHFAGARFPSPKI